MNVAASAWSRLGAGAYHMMMMSETSSYLSEKKKKTKKTKEDWGELSVDVGVVVDVDVDVVGDSDGTDEVKIRHVEFRKTWCCSLLDTKHGMINYSHLGGGGGGGGFHGEKIQQMPDWRMTMLRSATSDSKAGRNSKMTMKFHLEMKRYTSAGAVRTLRRTRSGDDEYDDDYDYDVDTAVARYRKPITR